MYNNCNDYERIKRKIDEEQKKYKFCYIQGPTGLKGNKGDKGDVGPATINIESTQTIDEGLAAKVSNVGTKDDVILNFEIPRGMKGDKGEQGPSTIKIGHAPISNFTLTDASFPSIVIKDGQIILEDN